jgi:hypothetical protein
MTARILIAVMLAASTSVASVHPADAGPLRDKLREKAQLAASLGKGGVKATILMTRCALKGKRGQIIC